MEWSVDKKEHFRHLLLFAYNQGSKATKAARDICAVYGEDAMAQRTAQKWFSRFRKGQFDLTDNPRSGRPSEFDVELLNKLIVQKPHQTSRELAERMGCAHNTVLRHLYTMGKVKKRKGAPEVLSKGSKRHASDKTSLVPILNTVQKSKLAQSIENDIKLGKQQQAILEVKKEYKEKDNIRIFEKIYAVKLEGTASKKNVEDYADFQYVNKLINNSSDADDVEAPDDNSQVIALDNDEFSIPVDPITKRPIENPCKSDNCEHVYEYESILNYIRHRMKMNLSKVCPVVGCVNNNLTLTSITVDDELKEPIRAS